MADLPTELQRDPEYALSKCRSCNDDIIWAVAEKSLRSIPVDARPVKNGNIRLIPRSGQVPLARTLTVDQQARAGARPMYQTHFVSCPNADRHRTGKRRRP